MNLLDKVKFVGVLTDRKELEKYYAVSDLFLFPSLYDNAPLVVREAAALSTPSVLIKGATCAEIVEDGYNGFLSEHSIDAFSHKIRHLINSREEIRFAGKNASQTIARSWEDVAEEVHDRYMKLIKRKACV